ncbi:hypothetical protein KAH55_13255 [bacterium]|nr:hypothetical protein [bacterium]
MRFLNIFGGGAKFCAPTVIVIILLATGLQAEGWKIAPPATNTPHLTVDSWLKVGGVISGDSLSVRGMNIGSLSITDITAIGDITAGGLVTKDTVVTLADDAEWIGPTGVAAWGSCQIGDAQEWIDFSFNADASVIELRDGSANIANTDSDGNLCIYDGGAGPNFKNGLGSSLRFAVSIKYYTP